MFGKTEIYHEIMEKGALGLKPIIPYTHETADLSGEWREVLPGHFLLAENAAV